MTPAEMSFALSVVIGLMMGERRLSKRNEAALRARGAVEARGDVYWAMAILYPLAFVLMGAEGLWRSRPMVVVGTDGLPVVVAVELVAPALSLAGILLMVGSKALKYWAIVTLRERWTFKVLVLPGAPLVRTGPYRHVDHPNYIAVVGELVGMLLMMQAWTLGPVLIFAFGVALMKRVRVETRALRGEHGR